VSLFVGEAHRFIEFFDPHSNYCYEFSDDYDDIVENFSQEYGIDNI
jgi:hypothetical protein